MKSVLLSAVVLALVACGGAKSGPADQQQAATSSGAASPVTQARRPTPAKTEEGPLNLSEERFQSYVTYRHELHATMRSTMQDLAKAGQHADTKSTDLGKTATALQDLAEVGQKHKGEVEAVHTKYGFSDAEDKRIWDAASEVLMASPENPMLKDARKMFLEMSKQGGPTKQAADDYLAKAAEEDKKHMEHATQKYGADAVAVLSRHIPELHELQMDALQAAFGGKASPSPGLKPL